MTVERSSGRFPEAGARLRSAAIPSEPQSLSLRLPEPLESTFAEEYFRQAVSHHRTVLLLGLVVFALFGLLDRWTIPEAPRQLWLIRYGMVCPTIAAVLALTYAPAFPRFAQLALSVAMLTVGLGLVLMSVVAPAPADQTFYVGLMLLLISFHMLLRVRFTLTTAVTWTIVAAYEAAALWIDRLPAAVALNNTFFLVTANLIGMFASYSIERHARTDFLQRRAIEAEQRRSELLLLNILPAAIAERLKHSDELVADSFPEATVLFADLVAFTPFADQLSPEELVTLLNEMFSAFDEVADRYGLEKIKTMGDCYMLVGGLPVPRPDHAEAVAEAALEMRSAMARFSARRPPGLELRIGIHTGPVVAGVIGTHKFSYDLWGDTVNTASRMESHGVAGGIQVSRATYERLRGKYRLAERGVVEVKGKGGLDTYLLVDRLPDATPATRPSEAPASPR